MIPNGAGVSVGAVCIIPSRIFITKRNIRINNIIAMEDMVAKQYQQSQKRLFQYLQSKLPSYPSLDHADQVPTKILQKLQLLQDSIEQKETSNYDQLSPDEAKQLIEHSMPIKIRMFVDIVGSFLFQEGFVKGKLDVKGKSGLFWNQKELTVDLNQSRLTISRQDASKEPEVFQLDQCSLKWNGMVKSRYAFQIMGKTVVTMGSEDMATAEQWFNYIKQCCASFEDDLLKKAKYGRQSAGPPDIQNPKKQPTQGQKIQKSSHSDTKSLQPLSEQPSQCDIPPLSEIFKTEKPLRNESDIPLQQFVKTQTEKPLVEIPQNDTINQLWVSQSQDPQKNSLHSTKPESKQQSFIETHVHQSEHTLPALMRQVLEDKRILTKKFLTEDYNFQLVSFKNKLRLLQHKQNHLINKAVIVLNTENILNVVSSIISPDETKNWNSQVEAINLVDVLGFQNAIIINEVRKKFGLLYLKRIFNYMRYYQSTDEGFFVVDKSLPSQHTDPYSIQGEITLQVIGVFKHREGQTLLVIYTQGSNGGYANKAQDGAMTIQYLKELENLEAYLSQKETDIQLPFYLEVLTQTPKQVVDLKREAFNPRHTVFEDLEPESKHMTESFLAQSLPQSEKQLDDLYQEDPEMNIQQMESKLKEEIQLTQTGFSIDSLQTLLQTLTERPQKIWSQQLHNYPIEPLEPDQKYFQLSENNTHIMMKNDWVLGDKGGYKFVNKKKLELQKDVISFILKRLGANLMQGKFSLVSVSLPVYIFEKRSNLERLCFSLTYLWLLEKAGGLKDPIEQMKLIIQFSYSQQLLYLNMEKPFNPILGETYQGYCNGNLIYAEQISHHPPIASLLIKGRNFTLSGHLEQQAFFNPNSINGQNIGYLKIHFAINNQSYIYNCAPGLITGMAYGARMFYLDGTFWIINEASKLVGEILMQPFPGMFSKKTTPQDSLDGYIYRVSDREINRYRELSYKSYDGCKGQGEKLSRIEGRWSIAITIDGQECINWSKDLPYQLENEKAPLASDCNLREDVIALRMDDLNLAQERKEKLEILQRQDRKLREHKKKKK